MLSVKLILKNQIIKIMKLKTKKIIATYVIKMDTLPDTCFFNTKRKNKNNPRKNDNRKQKRRKNWKFHSNNIKNESNSTDTEEENTNVGFSGNIMVNSIT